MTANSVSRLRDRSGQKKQTTPLFKLSRRAQDNKSTEKREKEEKPRYLPVMIMPAAGRLKGKNRLDANTIEHCQFFCITDLFWASRLQEKKTNCFS